MCIANQNLQHNTRMFASIATTLLSIISIATDFGAFAGTVEVFQVDTYSSISCSSSKVSSPFLLGNSCMDLGSTISLKPNCDTQQFQEFTSSNNCSGVSLGGLPFTCEPGQTVIEGVQSITVPASGYSCTSYDDSNVMIMLVGGNCDSAAATDVSQILDFSFQVIILVIPAYQCLSTPELVSHLGHIK